MTDWYDHPELFDLAFRDETGPEADFIEAACRRFALGPVRRVLEPACGTGRLIVELSRRGYETIGFDLNASMLAFARRQLSRRKLSAELFTADMAEFSLDRPVDAVLNTFNSFRHLLTDDAALAHLRCVVKALRPGGLFILGLHLLPPDASEESCERWTATSGSRRLTATLKVIASNRRRRLETLRISLLARSPQGEQRVRSDFTLRIYSPRQLKKLLAEVPELELCGVYDFWYEIDQPLPLTDTMSDTVLVLRKR